jgi:hypothetical protein
MQSLAGKVRHVRWEDVTGLDTDRVVLSLPQADLLEHDPAVRRAG